MTSNNLATRLGAFLDSVDRSYPYGVPRQPRNHLSKKISFIVPCNQKNNFLGTQPGQLLEAAVTKGLKLSMSDIDVVCAGSGITIDLGTLKSRVVMLLGESCLVSLPNLAKNKVSVGTTYESGGKIIFVSRDLEQSLADATVKREFWGDLKNALNRL